MGSKIFRVEKSNNKSLKYKKCYIYKKDRKKFPSIKDLNPAEEKKIFLKILDYNDIKIPSNLDAKDILNKYEDEISTVCKIDKDTKNIFGFVNTSWVFSQVSKEINYSILMYQIENVGYKRTKRGEKPKTNDLYRTDKNGEIIIDDGKKLKALDHLRDLDWDKQ